MMHALLAQLGADAALLGQSAIVQIGAALGALMGLGLPGTAIAWKVVRNGRKNGNGVALGRIERMDAQHAALCDRVTEMSEQSARAIADLRREVREDLGTVRESVSKVHARIDVLVRGGP
jgi:hypothetical protein